MSASRPKGRPLTRGPLPPEVYWRRRFFVVALAFTLVFVIGSALSGGNDAEDDDAVAQQAAAPEPSTTVTVNGNVKNGKGKKRRSADGQVQGPAAPSTELADPEGPCADGDVVVTPVVETAVGGQDVTIGLQLQTREAAACTWKVTTNSVAVKILDGDTEIWTSRECPRAIPNESVVVRWAVATMVEMTWADARESDADCSRQAGWAMPGDYTVVAAALGGEPAEATFDLLSPEEAASSGIPSQTPSDEATESTDDPTNKQSTEPTDAASTDGDGKKRKKQRQEKQRQEEPRR